MLPIVSKEACNIVRMQLESNYIQYITKITEKIKKSQPHLYEFLIDNAKSSLKDLQELEGEELDCFIIMSITGIPFVVYEMVRNQDEADELNKQFNG